MAAYAVSVEVGINVVVWPTHYLETEFHLIKETNGKQSVRLIRLCIQHSVQPANRNKHSSLCWFPNTNTHICKKHAAVVYFKLTSSGHALFFTVDV